MIEILIYGWVLTLFNVDELVINGINQIFHTNYTVAVYWLIVFLIAAISTIFEETDFFKKYEKYKDRKLKSQKDEQKEAKKKIKDYGKKKGNLNSDALKFEYRFLVDRVNKVIEDMFINNSIKANELYILKLDEYFREFKSIRDVNTCSIEGLACLCKAIINEPIMSDSIKSNERIVLRIIENMCPRYISKLSYNNVPIEYSTKDELIVECMQDYMKFNNEIFFMCAFVIDRLHW